MDDSPYKTPRSESFEESRLGGGDDALHEKIAFVAKYQRWVIFSVLANIGFNILFFAMQNVPFPARLVLPAVALPVLIFMMASVFMLTRRVINTAVGVLFAALMIVPCVSLIILLVINQMATSFLQRNGIRVGFFGVNPNRI